MHDGASFESTHRIDATLRAFDGHFPGAPVLPGACLLAIVLERIESVPALRAALGSPLLVQQVKFLAPVGPGQLLGTGIEGGETHHLVKGDVIVIPAGVPHWFKEVRGPLLYFTVKPVAPAGAVQ